MTALENFRVNLHDVMERQHLSQRDLADKADMTQAYLSRLLRGKVEEPSIPKCESIAQALGIPFWEMVKPPQNPSRRRRPVAA